jgi:SAM-dependent methyltransferase
LPSFLQKLKQQIRKNYFGLAEIDFDQEIQPYIGELKGLVFNAGSGHRPLKIDLPTISTDFDEKAPVTFLSDLHYIPLQDECVDSVITIAVLEHTRYPWVVIKEIARILKPGGTIVFCVPFIQPEHATPHDFYRYTVYGVEALLTYAGFEIKSQTRLSRFYRALGWLLKDKWSQRKGLPYYLGLFVVNLISRYQQDAEQPPYSIYTGSYTVGIKPGHLMESPIQGTINIEKIANLLIDPVNKAPLHLVENRYLENNQGQRYELVNGKFDLRPKANLSQDNQVKWGEVRKIED